MKKKIAIILERADIILGGAERSGFELSRALGALGHEVEILAAKGKTTAKNVQILCGEKKGKRISCCGFAKVLKKYLPDKDYDIIHSFLPFDFCDIYQPRGGSYAEATFRNSVSYLNNLIGFYKRVTSFANIHRTKLLLAEKRVCTKEDGPIIVALSSYVAEQFQRHYGVKPQRIVTVCNGVKVNKQIDIEASEKLKGQILLKLGLKEADEPVFLLFAANNFRLKGLKSLMQAMSVLEGKGKGSRVYLIAAGSGKIKRYKHLAKQLDVEKRVIFLGTVGNIQNLLSISDVGVLPTYYDPASRFILEVLGAGKPVITTRFNGAVDMFVDGRHGIVTDSPDDIDALVEGIEYFSDRANIAKVSGAIVKDNLKEEISITRVAKELDSLYDLILEKRK